MRLWIKSKCSELPQPWPECKPASLFQSAVTFPAINLQFGGISGGEGAKMSIPYTTVAGFLVANSVAQMPVPVPRSRTRWSGPFSCVGAFRSRPFSVKIHSWCCKSNLLPSFSTFGGGKMYF